MILFFNKENHMKQKRFYTYIITLLFLSFLLGFSLGDYFNDEFLH